MNKTIVGQMGCRRAILWATLLFCLGGPACFRTPDTSKIPCVGPSNCPSKFHCVTSQGANQGVCAPGPASAADGSTPDSATPTSPTDARLGGAGGVGGTGGAGGTTSGGSSATGGSSTVDAYLAGAGGAGGTSTSSGGTSTVDAPLAGAGGAGGASTGSGGTSTVDVPPAGSGGVGGAGGAGTKLDAPAGTGGTTALTTGAKCTDDSQCTLGFCVDGVCCDNRCGGQCQACAETGSVGTCTTVQSGDPRGTRTPCSGTGKCKGQCDGSSATACKMPGNTTVCLSETCSAGQHTPQSVCNSAGACPGQTASACSSGSCATDGSGKCLGACTSTSCPTDQYCASTGTCAPKKGNGPGNTCTTGAECTSTHCSSAEGICCDTDCTGQCQSCSTGTCTRVASGQPVGGRPACTGSTDTTCGGRCNNTSDNCYFPPAGTQCLAATCSTTTTHQFAKTCPGNGSACASPNPPSEACAYGCTGTACAACTPNCTGKCGGPDGCNGLCSGTCPSGQTCGGGSTPNVCGCTPSCNGKCGGPDSCGGTCPNICGSQVCYNNTCCAPSSQCGSGQQCGTASNGCGGFVNCGPNNGGCPTGLHCSSGACVCNAGACTAAPSCQVCSSDQACIQQDHKCCTMHWPNFLAGVGTWSVRASTGSAASLSASGGKLNISVTYITGGPEVIYLDVNLCGTSLVPVSQFTMFVDFINSDGTPFGGDGTGGGSAILYVNGSANGTTLPGAELYNGVAPTSGAWSVPVGATSGATGFTVTFQPTWSWSGTISVSEVRLDP